METKQETIQLDFFDKMIGLIIWIIFNSISFFLQLNLCYLNSIFVHVLTCFIVIHLVHLELENKAIFASCILFNIALLIKYLPIIF